MVRQEMRADVISGKPRSVRYVSGPEFAFLLLDPLTLRTSLLSLCWCGRVCWTMDPPLREEAAILRMASIVNLFNDLTTPPKRKGQP